MRNGRRSTLTLSVCVYLCMYKHVLTALSTRLNSDSHCSVGQLETTSAASKINPPMKPVSLANQNVGELNSGVHVCVARRARPAVSSKVKVLG